MRLLIAADIFPPESGGPATYAVVLANELSRQGVEVRIVSLNSESDKNVLDPNVKMYPVYFSNKILRYKHYFWLLFIYAKSVDVIYAMGPVNAGLPAWLVARLSGKKFVVKVVGDYAWEQGQVSGKVKDSIDEFQLPKRNSYGLRVGILRLAERLVVRKADLVIVPSKYLVNIVERWGARKKKIKLIYNEVEYTLGNPIKHDDEKWLVSVGRLMPWKGMDILIEVIADLSGRFPESKWRLKIVGDGPEMDRLKKKVLDYNLADIVRMVGNLTKEKTMAYMASADVFVLNSAYEGFSHVLIEAHNQGVPVIASNAGGNPEIVGRDNLFEYNDKKEIVEKVSRVCVMGEIKSIPRRFSTNMINDTKEALENVRSSVFQR